ncbi:Exportin-4 [Dirofilaria immitis]
MPSTKGKKPTTKIEFDEKHIKQIEEMAQILTTPTTTTSRKHIVAIRFFRDLNNVISLEQCRTIFEKSTNEYVLTTVPQVIISIIFKQWTTLEASIKREFFNFLFTNALSKFRNSVTIRGELLKACAKLAKRSIFDGHACDFDAIACRLYVLLTDEEPEYHVVIYEFFLKILDEFDKYWRITELGVPYDFQYKAKIAFEEKGLLQFYSRCLHIIPRFCILISDFQLPANKSMVQNFLSISHIIFGRNFGIHHFSNQNDALIRGPPKTWRAIFYWNEFLQLFFSLHKFLRNDQKLLLLATNCITQLTVIRDVILPDVIPFIDSKGKSVPDIPYSTAYDKYISNLLACSITLFNGEIAMPQAYGHCLMIANILTTHPIQSLARAESSFPIFISFIPELTENFAVRLLSIMNKKVSESEEEKIEEKVEGKVDEKVEEKTPMAENFPTTKWTYISAIQHLFKGWLIILQNSDYLEEVFNYAINFSRITIIMISSFMQTMFSIPFGDREEVSVPLPDREIFKEIMIKIGTFSSYFLDQMLPKIFTILAETVEEFLATTETEMSDEDLNMWRENMHWILLGVEEERTDIDNYAFYIEACISSPQTLTDPPNIDLVIKIIGTVFAWCSIEDELLKDHGIIAINPDLCCTSLWCAKRLISAIGLYIEKTSDKNDRLAKILRTFTQILVDFALQKSFRIFELMPDEKKVCLDAIELLAVLAHTMHREASRSIFLFSYLSSVQTDQLLVRTSLIKVLVEIGSVIDDEAKQRTLHEMILIPIRFKFLLLCESPESANENIDDLLDCFCAVIDAMKKCTANFLFAYLVPVLKSSVKLLSTYKDSSAIINAILQFFDCLTKKMYIYCDNHNDIIFLYKVLLDIVQIYDESQAERFKNADSKEKTTDLITLLTILTNALDRKSRPVNLLTGKTKFVENRLRIIATTWNMLLSIMQYDFLRSPVLRKIFYRFLKISTEMAPEYFVKLSHNNFTIIIEYLRHGLQAESEKDDLLLSLKNCFVQEISIDSALSIANLGIFLAKNIRYDGSTKILSILIEPTFTICLNTMWQEDEESLATSSALYSLLCCAEDTCKTYVKKLLSCEANHPNQATLRNAFRILMSQTAGKCFERSKMRDFHSHLKQFLTRVEVFEIRQKCLDKTVTQ